jgi:hypothetical protein
MFLILKNYTRQVPIRLFRKNLRLQWICLKECWANDWSLSVKLIRLSPGSEMNSMHFRDDTDDSSQILKELPNLDVIALKIRSESCVAEEP